LSKEDTLSSTLNRSIFCNLGIRATQGRDGPREDPANHFQISRGRSLDCQEGNLMTSLNRCEVALTLNNKPLSNLVQSHH